MLSSSSHTARDWRDRPGDTPKAEPAGRIENSFADSGICREYVLARVNSIVGRRFNIEVPEYLRKAQSSAERFHGDVVYLNSSDSFANIAGIADLAGMRILTVAGSGDFPLAFIAHGASSVDVIDVSLPACFLTELKILAAARLDFADFSRMFGTYAVDFDKIHLRPSECVELPIFDRVIYRSVRAGLSEPARTYFDTIIERDLVALCKIGVMRTPSGVSYFDLANWQAPEHGLVRLRAPVNRKNAGPSCVLSPFVQDEESFARLKANVDSSVVRISVRAFSAADLNAAGYDYVYMSNVNYRNALETADKLVQSGAPRVGLTLSVAPLTAGFSGFSVLNFGVDALELVFGKVARRELDATQVYGAYVELESRDRR